MDADALKSLKSAQPETYDDNYYVFTETDKMVGGPMTEATAGILGGLEASMMFPYGIQQNSNERYYTVDDCEWIRSEKQDSGKLKGKYVQFRYRCVRIGKDIFIPFGKINDIPRSISNPEKATLSLNGRYLIDGNGSQYSLILKLADLQDEYDITNFFEDCMVHNAGSVGQFIDVNHLPAFLGPDLETRIIKWLGYYKNGMALYNSAQEGEDSGQIS